MFSPDFINWLASFRLPEYELHKVEGQYELHFHGSWAHTTMWEIPALAILNELRSRQVMKGQGRFALDVLCLHETFDKLGDSSRSQSHVCGQYLETYRLLLPDEMQQLQL